MASSYTQDERVAGFVTPMGANDLVVASFKGEEGLSELFEYELEVVNTSKATLTFDEAIGKNCTLTMRTIDGGERHFDGILTEARWLSGTTEGSVYRLILRPWLWLLSKRTNCLIFRDKTAPQIIKQIFEAHGGLADFQDCCSKSHPVLEYCAQYRESDMDFVCRLMEQHGISYHFRHEKGAHKLYMGDDSSVYQPVAGASRPFNPVDKNHKRDSEHLSEWQPERKFTTGKITLNDYDFKKPTAKLEAEKTGDAKYAHAQLEDYDYPGKYVKQSEGLDYAQARLDMVRAEDSHYLANGDCVSLAPGNLMTLTGHPEGAQNEQYRVLHCTHVFTGQAYRSARGDSLPYAGTYEFMRADKPFAPPIVTEKPFVHGPQTAKVIGEGEIDCDEHGRILVRFHWDRKSDQSRRVRVAQVWASQNWGAIFTPRIGMEVVVDFLEGDPDQPIVIGCVYNGDNKPPYKLPDKKNISGWKSNSTTGGKGYNELIMDDTASSELVRFHAQKDLDSTIENDEKREVKHDRKTKIGNDDTLRVDNELLIDAGMKITIKVGQSSIVMDGMSIKIESPTVDIKAKMAFTSKSDLLSKHEAAATFIIKGGIVLIN